MKYNAEQVLNGLINYADAEVMEKLPTSGKWIMGTAIGLASTRAQEVIHTLSNNAIAQMLGVIDEDGMIDVESVLTAMKTSADRYGKVTIDVPIVGRLTFASSDVDSLRNYIV